MNNCNDSDDCRPRPPRPTPVQRVFYIGPTGPTGPSGGPTGPTGATGATGPTGSSFNNYAMVSSNSDSTVGAVGGVVILEDVDRINGINYDAATGIFTFPTAGTYLVNWWFNVCHIAGNPTVLSATLYQTTPVNASIIDSVSAEAVEANNCITLVGDAIITVTAGATYNFQNTSAEDFHLRANQRTSGVITITRIA